VRFQTECGPPKLARALEVDPVATAERMTRGYRLERADPVSIDPPSIVPDKRYACQRTVRGLADSFHLSGRYHLSSSGPRSSCGPPFGILT
jgi:hypothetical protein